MKTFSPNKLFTAVVLMVVSLALSSLATAQITESKEDCEARVENETNLSQCAKMEPEAKSDCESGLIKSAKREKCSGKPLQSSMDRKDQKCESAKKDYRDVLKKTGNVCSKFESTGKSTKNSCQDRVDACRKKIKSGMSGSSGNDTTALMQTMTSIYMQKNYPDAAQAGFAFDSGEGMGPSCVKYQSKEDRKEAKQDAEKLEDKIARIKEKIADEKKKINDENAKLREKTDDLANERLKVDEKLKEEIAKLDKDKQAKAAQIAKEISENSNSIRKLSNQIVKFKEQAEAIKFEHTQKMTQFAEDKITTQCNAAIEQAKTCYISNTKNKNVDPKSTCANFTLSAKGAKGTAELKQKLEKVKEACFEQASLATKKSNYDNASKLRDVESNITEYTAQINSANQALAQKQKEYQEIGSLDDKDKENANTNANKQLEQMTQKADNLTRSTTEAVQTSNAKIAEFQKELNEINTKKTAQKMGIADAESVEYTFSEAESAIDEQETARMDTVAACCKDAASKKANEGFCKKLDDAATTKSQKDGGFSNNKTGASAN